MEHVHIDFRDQIAANKRKSFFLLAFIVLILVTFATVIGYAYDPASTFLFLIIAIIFSLGYAWFSYYNSDKIAIRSVRAREAKQSEFKDYHRLVEGLTIASGLPKPRLYVMDSPQINAFASGRDPHHAVICVTTGCLQKLDRRELEAVLAHELGHVANYDIRYITLVSVAVGMIAILSEIFLRSLWFRSGNNDNSKAQVIFLIIGVLLAILAPIVVYFVQLAISRKREYSADATAVKFTRYPDGLLRALEKIQHDHAPAEKKVSKAVAPLFFANPFKSMGSTHPPVADRIKALRSM